VAATNQGITIASSSSLAQMTISNANVLVGNQFGGATFNIAGGSYGTGALTMCAGTLTSTGLTDTWYIGFNSGSKGSVWIDGGTVTATNGGYLFLGLEGAGEWTMTNGSVAVANLYEGLLGGTGTLRIPGGTFSVLSNTTLAGASSTVWVTGGQFLTPDGAVISSMIISSGLAVARNMNISLNNAASGVLSIYGGQVVLFDSLVVGNCASNAIGQVTVNGGILYVTNSTHTGCLDLSGGTLTLNSGSIIVDQLIMTNPCAKLVRTGGTLVYGTALLDPNASAVGDGIPNGWKQQYGLDPFDPNLANEDSDGDGMSNLQEYLAGTDPTNSASAFRITSVVSTGNDILVNWMTGIGRTNALQALTNPEFTNNFTDIFTVTNAVGTTTNYLDIGAATNVPSRFYRVRLVP
jgi:T5SS/PEP-CTERM-associated repeat protein